MPAPDPAVLDRPAAPAARHEEFARSPAAAAGPAPPPPRSLLAVVRQLERAWPLYVVAILLVLILV